MKFEKDGEEIRHEDKPEFPLIPASKGFCISLEKAVLKFRECLAQAGIGLEGDDEEDGVLKRDLCSEAKFAQVVHPDDV